MKKWKLKKDLPSIRAGAILKESQYSNDAFVYYDCLSGLYNCQDFPEDTRSEWLEEVEERWRPKEGDTFFYTRLENVIELEWPDEEEAMLHNLEEKFLDTYNCFRTREQAEECSELCLETRKKYTESLDHE